MRPGIWTVLLYFLAGQLGAQEDEQAQALRFNIDTRFLTIEKVVDWSSRFDQDALSGQPVIVRIQGDNFILKVTLTGFIQSEDILLLVAQTEVHFQDGSRRALNKSLLSQQVKLGNPVFYYPMGKDRKSTEGHTMEMEILISFPEGIPETPE